MLQICPMSSTTFLYWIGTLIERKNRGLAVRPIAKRGSLSPSAFTPTRSVILSFAFFFRCTSDSWMREMCLVPFSKIAQFHWHCRCLYARNFVESKTEHRNAISQLRLYRQISLRHAVAWKQYCIVFGIVESSSNRVSLRHHLRLPCRVQFFALFPST